MSEAGFFRILLVSVLSLTLLGWGLALHTWQAGTMKIAKAVESPTASLPQP
jgi:hypothetical protein